MRAAPLLAAAFLLAAPAAVAQSYPQSYPQASGSSYGQPQPGGYGGYDRRDAPPPTPPYSASTADRAAPAPEPDLARELKLRADQRAAYRDYRAAFDASQDMGDGDEREDVARLAAMTTPQRLDDAARQMEMERSAFDRVAAATRRFYASLDSGQRRTFDRVTAPSLDAGPDDQGAEGRGPGSQGGEGYATPRHPPQVQPRN